MPISTMIKSGLKQTVEELPEDFAMKAQSVPGMLKKSGVKEEELKFAGMDLPTEGKVTKQDLVKAEAGRKDEMGVFEIDLEDAQEGIGYNWVSLQEGKDNPTYKERIYTFDAEGHPGYTSSHYEGVPNYLMHTRVYDDELAGAKTRIVQEIQSDLHQEGRQRGYDDLIRLDKEKVANIKQQFDNVSVDLDDDEAFQQASSAVDALVAMRPGFLDTESALELLERPVNEIVSTLSSGAPTSPFEKNWLRKAMEREVASAIDDGREAIAIPLSGEGTRPLKRAEGVQKWYGTSVDSTMKKLAKAMGLDYTKVTKASGEDFTFSQWSKDNQDLVNMVNKAIASPDGDALLEVAPFLPPKYKQLVEDHHIALGEGQVSVKDLFSTADKRAGDVEYGVIKLDKPAKGNLTLYSSPAAGAFFVYQGMKLGATEEELKAELETAGYDPEDFDEFMSDARFIDQAVAMGASEDEARDILMEQTKEPVAVEEVPLAPAVTKADYWSSFIPGGAAALTQKAPPVKAEAYANLVDPETGMTDKELLRNLKVIAPNMSSITTRVSGFFGNQQDARIASQAEESARIKIAQLAKERGFDLMYDNVEHRWLANTPEGPLPIDQTMWDDMRAESGEIFGGVSGAMLGARFGAVLGPKGAFAGSLLGAAAGAAAGSQTDYLYSSLKLHEDMAAEVAAHKALTAAEVSVLADTVGFGAFKLAGKAWNGGKNAVQFLKNGEKNRAMRALQDEMFLTPQESEAAVQQLNRMVNLEGLDDAQAKLYASVSTVPGMEELVKAAAGLDAKASRATQISINRRAQDLLDVTKKMSDDQAGKILKDDIANYIQDVKSFYGYVKKQAAMSPKAEQFKFDYDKLAIEPALEAVERELMRSGREGPLSKFALQAQVIRDMKDSQSFTDLLELRQLVNEFRYNKAVKGTKAANELFRILKQVDGAITNGAKVAVEKPEQWLQDYAQARKMYSEMKGVEKNALTKILNRPGINEEQVVKQVSQKITAIDNTFEEILRALPKKSRGRTENAVISVLTDKYTIGKGTGMRATHFPMLADDLSKITFTTPDARKLKKAISEMSEVFKNDVPLAQVTGNITVPKFQSYLTTDPVVRAKFEAASAIFNTAKQYAPTESGAAINLVKKTAKVLENPLDSRSIKELMEEAGDKVNIAPEIRKLADEAARAQAKGTDMYKVKLYETPDGRLHTKPIKGGEETSIAMDRIATYEAQKEVAEAQGIHPQNKEALAIALKRQGYSAVQIGEEKVRRLK